MTNCPVCQSTHVRGMMEIPEIPVLCNVLWESRAAALAAARGNVQLTFCETCGHLYNRAFDPALMEYNVQYENSLHFSPLFQNYAAWLAKTLVERYDLHGKNIIEIGSGKGDFLRLLCETGGNRGAGFDPSYEPGPDETYPAITFVKDIYSERYAGYPADLILSRHVLEHIPRPADFIQSLRRTIGLQKQAVDRSDLPDRGGPIVFCEVPNLGYILRDTAIWDIIYEHYSYFGANSLASLFTRCGFQVLNLADAFEGQFLYIEAAPRDAQHPMDTPNPQDALKTPPIETLAGQVADFTARSQAKIDRWNEQVAGLRRSGRRAVLWGAGSKGISFLNMLHIQDEIPYVVDINPRKRGKYVTGAGQQIVPPEFLASSYRPDTIIVMNPIYRQEIQGMVEQLGLHVDYLLAS